MTRKLLLLSCCLLLVACGGEQTNNQHNNQTTGTTAPPNNSTTNNGETTAPVDTTGDDGPTWHGDVRAIVEAECVQCHTQGGIGPFAMTSYEEVTSIATLVSAVVGNGTMPPWPPDEQCGGPFKYQRTLTDDEKSTIQQWVANGTPEGNPASYVAPEEVTQVDLGTPDYTIDIGVDYVPSPPGNSIDDYRCFIVEHDIDEEVFVRGYEVLPGNPANVHHVLFWQVGNENLERTRALESAPGEGYTCFGGNRTDEAGLLGVWAPGVQQLAFHEGTGFRLPADSFFVVQVHYNTLNGTAPDRTKIGLFFTDEPPAVPLGMYPLADTGIDIPAGRVDDTSNPDDARGNFNFRLPLRLSIYGVVPHMHMLGTRIRVTAGDQCLVDVPKWDFNWQGLYLYETPIEVSPQSNVQLNCWYDNSMANQQPGQTPRDVRWGDGTFDEMCLNYVITRELPI